MSKDMSVVALGVWVVVLPYLGIYRSWLTVLMVVTGVALLVLGFLLRGETIAREHHDEHTKQPRRKRASRTFEENAAAVSQDYTAPDHSTIGSLN